MKAEQGPLWGCDPEGRRGADKTMTLHFTPKVQAYSFTFG